MLAVGDRVEITKLTDDLDDFTENDINFAPALLGTGGVVTRVYPFGPNEVHPIWVKLDYNNEEYCFSETELTKKY